MEKRSGGISVFLVILFASFLVLVVTLLAAAKSAAGKSVADGAFRLAGRSVLSEYDRTLLKEYGILAFRGDEKEIESDIKFYAGATLNPSSFIYLPFRGKEETTKSIRLNIDSVDVSLKAFSLLDLDNFEKALKNGAVSAWLKDRKEKKEDGGVGGKSKETNRELKNQSVLRSLPSAGYDSPLFPSIDGIADLFKGGQLAENVIGTVAVDEYILSAFTNNHEVAEPLENHFFRNEVEYILAGKNKDEKNYSDIKWRLRALRLALNTAHILTDHAKMEAIGEISTAAAMFKGVAIIAMVVGWAAAETHNDMMRLEDGKKVAFLKSKRQWALTDPVKIFDSIGQAVADGVGEVAGYDYTQEVKAPADESGWTYKGYIRMFLFFLDRETKLLRVMDLMQINLKGSYYEDFLIREYYVGFRYEAVVDGDTYAYTEKY